MESSRKSQDQWVADTLDAFEADGDVRVDKSAVHFSKQALLDKNYAILAEKDFGDGTLYLGVKATDLAPQELRNA